MDTYKNCIYSKTMAIEKDLFTGYYLMDVLGKTADWAMKPIDFILIANVVQSSSILTSKDDALEDIS